MKRWVIAAAALAASVGVAGAAESIAGKWRTANGETADISRCGGGYCVTLETGQHKGKRIGRFSGSGDTYSGELTDPASDRTYSGTGALQGSSMKLTGCALKVFCRSQTWTKL